MPTPGLPVGGFCDAIGCRRNASPVVRPPKVHPRRADSASGPSQSGMGIAVYKVLAGASDRENRPRYEPGEAAREGSRCADYGVAANGRSPLT